VRFDSGLDFGGVLGLALQVLELTEPFFYVRNAGIGPQRWLRNLLGRDNGLEPETTISWIGLTVIVLPPFDLVRNSKGKCSTIPFGLVIVPTTNTRTRGDLDWGSGQFLHPS